MKPLRVVALLMRILPTASKEVSRKFLAKTFSARSPLRWPVYPTTGIDIVRSAWSFVNTFLKPSERRKKLELVARPLSNTLGLTATSLEC